MSEYKLCTPSGNTKSFIAGIKLYPGFKNFCVINGVIENMGTVGVRVEEATVQICIVDLKVVDTSNGAGN